MLADDGVQVAAHEQQVAQQVVGAEGRAALAVRRGGDQQRARPVVHGQGGVQGSPGAARNVFQGGDEGVHEVQGEAAAQQGQARLVGQGGLQRLGQVAGQPVALGHQGGLRVGGRAGLRGSGSVMRAC
ncbi:hypothetical protein ACFQDE_04460 [Deinococcus caeni]|uniref:hypothetical protein n=1 Tax=Deinococcus caeni TaxID=569127 RepID=UPI0036149AE4